MKRSEVFKSRLIALTLGVFLSFIAIELSLRALGQFEKLQRKNNLSRDSSSLRILCVGNSYTYGAGAPRGKSYPDQLQQILDTGYLSSQVINRGLLNVNSTFIAEALPAWLKEDRPHLVFAMVGEPNGWNKYGYWKYLRRVRNEKRHTYHLSDLFSWSKTYRLLEIFLDRPETWNKTEADFSGTFHGVGRRTAEDKHLLAYLWIGALEGGLYSVHQLRESERKEASEALHFLSTVEPLNPLIWRILADLRVNKWDSLMVSHLEKAAKLAHEFNYPLWYRLQELKKHTPHLLSSFLDHKLQAMESEISQSLRNQMLLYFSGQVQGFSPKQLESPDFLFAMNKAHPTDLVTLTRLAALSSSENSQKLLQAVITFINLNPLSPKSSFISHLRQTALARKDLSLELDKFMREKSTSFHKINLVEIIGRRELDADWIRADLEEMIQASRAAGAKVVIQTYPPLRNNDFRVIDEILRKWWDKRQKEEDVFFQDVSAELSEIFRRDPRPLSFYSEEGGKEDQHLNAKGNRILAETMIPFVKKLASTRPKLFEKEVGSSGQN